MPVDQLSRGARHGAVTAIYGGGRPSNDEAKDMISFNNAISAERMGIACYLLFLSIPALNEMQMHRLLFVGRPT